ncbi:MAG: hypothetical protein KGY67_00380 [Candidatus Thermoplasmatota archaeon]|nr:hypothetical protein [Candidatus Thermoplasmatota archaeon]
MKFLLSKIIDNNQTKILESLIQNKDKFLDIPEISKIAETPLDETIDYLHFLWDKKIIVGLNNELSGLTKYKMNENSDVAKAFFLFEYTVTSFKIDELIEGKT